MKSIYRDGIEYRDVKSDIKTRVTSDGHIIESWVTNEGKKVYFANLKNSVYCAHGTTAAEAIGEAIWKDPAKRPSLEKLVAKIKPKLNTYKISVTEFRILTGACKTGCDHFLQAHNLSSNVKMTLKEFLPIGGDWAKKLEQVLS